MIRNVGVALGLVVLQLFWWLVTLLPVYALKLKDKQLARKFEGIGYGTPPASPHLRRISPVAPLQPDSCVVCRLFRLLLAAVAVVDRCRQLQVQSDGGRHRPITERPERADHVQSLEPNRPVHSHAVRYAVVCRLSSLFFFSPLLPVSTFVAAAVTTTRPCVSS
jgi:hypothetical protein